MNSTTATLQEPFASGVDGDGIFRQLFESAHDPVITIDADGRVTAWNASASAQFGWSAEEVMGQSLSQFIIPPVHRAAHEAGMQRVLAGGEARILNRRIEITALTRTGKEIPIELSVWPINTARGMVFGAIMRDISQRRAREAALKTSEQRLRHVIENVSEGILVVQDGHIVFANPRTLELVDRTLDELRAKPFTEAIHPSDRAIVADHHRRRLAGEPVEPRYEFRVINGKGESVWVALSAVTIDWDGRPATLSFISNVSERKRLQDSLAQTLFERETILQNSIVGIAFLDAAGRVKWANRVLTQMFRAEGGDHIGKSLEPFYPSREEYLRIGAAVAQAVGQGKHFETELRMRRTKGDQFWAYLSGRAVYPNDLSQGTVWVVMDISTRKELEEKLRASTEQYQLVVENVTEGMTVVQDGKFTFANPAFLQLLGYSAEELIGKEFMPVVHPDDLPRIAANRERRLRGEAFESKFDFRALRKDGSFVWVQVSAVLVDWHGGPATLSFISDITRRKQAEEDIRRSLEKQRELNHLKSRFVAMTSHEFRTPLATILSSAELLKFYGVKMSAQERDEILDSIDASVKRMTKMLDDVLLIGKVEAEKLEFVPKPIPLKGLLDTIALEARQAANATKSAKPVEIETLFENCDDTVMVDEKLLRHMLGNLLSNAVKYSPNGGTVRFYAARGEKVIHLSVSDQGIGLPPEDIPRLFANFFRASNVGNIAGTGLGLAIVKHAATQHGGEISVSSELGKGTTFTINLPRQDPPGHAH